jgi:hypothetical protein
VRIIKLNQINRDWGYRLGLAKRLVNCAMEVTKSYPQKWGDCYKINSTAAYWLNSKMPKYNWRFEIWQVKAHLDGEIEDTIDNEKVMTNEPDHVVVYDTIAHEYYDFSTVLEDFQVFRYEFLDRLNGQEDKKLMSLLNKIK